MTAPVPVTRETVAAAIAADIEAAEGREPVHPKSNSVVSTCWWSIRFLETDHADQYLSHVTGDGVTPLLSQPRWRTTSP